MNSQPIDNKVTYRIYGNRGVGCSLQVVSMILKVSLL